MNKKEIKPPKTSPVKLALLTPEHGRLLARRIKERPKPTWAMDDVTSDCYRYKDLVK